MGFKTATTLITEIDLFWTEAVCSFIGTFIS
jgi:hypothetical protein